MIVAVEGPSAAGKTTWSRAQAEVFVPEYQPTGDESESTNLRAQAQYWATVNSDRWSQALHLEAQSGLALSDSDPLKLHYSWCLARIGAAPHARFKHELSAVREAFAREELGFADIIVISLPSADVLARQRENDPTRRRRQFALHAALAEPLATWYSAVDKVDPGRVFWNFPTTLDLADLPLKRENRSSLEVLRAVIDELPSLGSALV
ncbi:MAG: hypothetical protein U5O16_24865 [Rhodococcus sp. (in: high G+C Gram-positive bacteria)]|uniref:hypothetical protein n=1 Tax=Rhodococcus sp. TaxID=1831 RepID=UPI002AD6F0EE|nr:hypothetical protein [Rhodococcus sp. (in: high G+C Gram-positive bacteria)]